MTFGNGAARVPRLLQQLGLAVDAEHLGDVRRERERERAGAGAGVERALAAASAGRSARTRSVSSLAAALLQLRELLGRV